MLIIPLSSFQCVLCWGLMLCWWCTCCCAWLFGFKTLPCPFQKSTSTGTCRCSVCEFCAFGPRFFWRGYPIFQCVFKAFALLFWFICLFCAALDFAAIMIEVKNVLAVHLYCHLTFFLLFLLWTHLLRFFLNGCSLDDVFSRSAHSFPCKLVLESVLISKVLVTEQLLPFSLSPFKNHSFIKL